jgi:hypothetical protein
MFAHQWKGSKEQEGSEKTEKAEERGIYIVFGGYYL